MCLVFTSEGLPNVDLQVVAKHKMFPEPNRCEPNEYDTNHVIFTWAIWKYTGQYSWAPRTIKLY